MLCSRTSTDETFDIESGCGAGLLWAGGRKRDPPLVSCPLNPVKKFSPTLGHLKKRVPPPPVKDCLGTKKC